MGSPSGFPAKCSWNLQVTPCVQAGPPPARWGWCLCSKIRVRKPLKSAAGSCPEQVKFRKKRVCFPFSFGSDPGLTIPKHAPGLAPLGAWGGGRTLFNSSPRQALVNALPFLSPPWDLLFKVLKGTGRDTVTASRGWGGRGQPARHPQGPWQLQEPPQLTRTICSCQKDSGFCRGLRGDGDVGVCQRTPTACSSPPFRKKGISWRLTPFADCLTAPCKPGRCSRKELVGKAP